MKKALLLLSAVALFATSCDNSTETATTKPADSSNVAKAPENKAPEAPAASAEMPNFSTPELKALAQEYTTYLKDAAAAAKAGDATKIQELTAKATEWSTKTTEAMKGMTQEDVKAWTEHFQKVAQELGK